MVARETGSRCCGENDTERPGNPAGAADSQPILPMPCAPVWFRVDPVVGLSALGGGWYLASFRSETGFRFRARLNESQASRVVRRV